MTYKWNLLPTGVIPNLKKWLIIVSSSALALIIITALALGMSGGLTMKDFIPLALIVLVYLVYIGTTINKTKQDKLTDPALFHIVFADGYFYFNKGEEEIVFLPSAVTELTYKEKKQEVDVKLALDLARTYTLEEKEFKAIQFKMSVEEFTKFHSFVKDTL